MFRFSVSMHASVLQHKRADVCLNRPVGGGGWGGCVEIHRVIRAVTTSVRAVGSVGRAGGEPISRSWSSRRRSVDAATGSALVAHLRRARCFGGLATNEELAPTSGASEMASVWMRGGPRVSDQPITLHGPTGVLSTIICRGQRPSFRLVRNVQIARVRGAGL